MSFKRTLDLSGTLTSLKPRRLVLITPSGTWTFGFTFNLRAGESLTRLNESTGQWILSINRVDNIPLLRSRAVVLSDDLLARHRPAVPDLPPGILACRGPRDPGRRDLGDGTCRIDYEEE